MTSVKKPIKGFTAIKDGLLWRVQQTVPGRLPKILDSGFVSEGDAYKAVRLFQESVRLKAKPVGKARRNAKS